MVGRGDNKNLIPSLSKDEVIAAAADLTPAA